MGRVKVVAQAGEYAEWLQNPTTQAYFRAVEDLMAQKIAEPTLYPENADKTLAASASKDGYIHGLRAVLGLRAKQEVFDETEKSEKKQGKPVARENNNFAPSFGSY